MLSADLYFWRGLPVQALSAYLASISLLVFSAQLTVSLIIALVSLIGYRSYGSKTLLFLCVSFFLIGFGVSLQSLFNIYNLSLLQFLGGVSETAGYLILAVSHVYTVRSSFVTQSMPSLFALVIPNFFLLYTITKSVSFFLLLYIFVETLIFSIQNKSRLTIIPSAGFLLLTFSAYATLFLNSLTYLFVTVEIAKLLGFAVLAFPLAVFALKRGQAKY